MESPTEITSRARAPSLSVRFEDTCILIPPACLPSKSSLIRPRLITKSYSLPLWKNSPSKKSGPGPQSLDAALACDAACAEAEKERAEKKAFSLTVSVPSLTTKSKPRRPSLPLPNPCLSRRNAQCSDSSSPPTSPVSPIAPLIAARPPSLRRTPSVPQIQPAHLKQADTVPLRACCEACHPCVDAALAEGEHWSERWSSGAVRRYSEGEHVHLHAQRPVIFGVTHEWTPGGDADPDMALADALKIDEVEVKRRSGDFSHAVLNNRRVPPPADEDALADSDSDEPCPEPTPAPVPLSRCRAAVLEEEDEDMLFPLPSPRRSPNQSPNPSPKPTPTGSQVSLVVPLSGSQTSLSAPLTGSQTSLPMQAPKADKAIPPAPARPSPSISIPAAIPPAPAASSSSAPAPAAADSPASADTTPMSPLTPASATSPTHKRQRSTSPTVTRRPQPRRSSFSAASGSLLKGGASVLKGVAAGMTGGVGASVGVVR